jgi:5-methyltetrahydrofolate--homocysteine methyltransferase
VKLLKAAGLPNVKIMIGGAPITQAFADEIGADGYAADAGTAVDIAKKLVGQAA